MNDHKPLPELLTIRQVAESLQLDRRVIIRDLIRTGKLRAIMVGGRYRIERVSLEQYLQTATLGGP